MKKRERNINQFSNDSKSNNGYLYTNTEQLSCKVANKRVSDADIEIVGSLNGKSIIDVGCGDGQYTIEFLKYLELIRQLMPLKPPTKSINLNKFRL